jgi:hypothetical protein
MDRLKIKVAIVTRAALGLAAHFTDVCPTHNDSNLDETKSNRNIKPNTVPKRSSKGRPFKLRTRRQSVISIAQGA